jgi:hypothetical protein
VNGASNCPECGSRMAIKATNHGGGITFRIAECDCGERWELEERRCNRLKPCTAVHSRGQPPAVANPRSSGRGVGGPLPEGTGLISPSGTDPDSTPILLSNPDQTRARSKPETKEPGPFKAMRDAFVSDWQDYYSDKYPFEPKDASALANMIKRHPEFVERWASIRERYFGSSFWAGKRHPLHGLANNAREFAGPAGNGVPEKIQQSRDTARNWAHRRAG